MKPLAIDLFCGLGGWTEGLLAEGYRVIGFDNERHRYPAREFTPAYEDIGKGMSGRNKNGTTLINAAREQVHGFHRAPLTDGWMEYPAQLVLQDVLTIHGRQFASAALIVASPPCQEFSYMAMPWTKAKEKAARLLNGRDDPKRLTALFDACFRIQREASEAAGHHIPLVVENVCGAQKWVGRARWHYGSFYLWGDVPALMPIMQWVQKFNPDGTAHGVGSWFAVADSKNRGAGVKVPGLNWSNHGKPGYKAEAFNTTAEQRQRDSIANAQEGRKQKGSGAAWWRGEVGSKSSKSSARKAASAHIAKIPLELARHIAHAWKPDSPEASQ